MTNSSQRIIVKGRAIPVRGNDIDTDRIIPARFLKTVTFDGLGEHAFEDDRAGLSKDGKTHSFDEPKFAGATLLFVNKNFGCGSSREHAPQAIARWGQGIVLIVGESFAEIFYGNCQALGVPCPVVDAVGAEALMSLCEKDPNLEFEVDLEKLEIRAGGQTVRISLPDGPRKSFLEGTWDSTGILLSAAEAIRKKDAELAYLRRYAD
jgi:3-isopropylmalate/(R)-2-methylmalate dehydratase small subunit